MYKKRELVDEILDKLKHERIILPEGFELLSPTNPWAMYPDGHYNDPAHPSIEGLLSCLLLENLEMIVKDTPPYEMEFHTLWKKWGQQGYLKSTPIVLEVNNFPVLRIRHDSYLSWYGGYWFQNTRDAYGHGSSGESWGSLVDAMKICKFLTAYYPGWVDCSHALMAAFPLSTCSDKYSFCRALSKYPEVFDEFLQGVDQHLLHTGLPADRSIEGLKATMQETKMCTEISYEFPVICLDQLAALLYISKQSVQLVWSENDQRHSYTINFPLWDDALKMDESTYLTTMWESLAITELILAGFMVTPYFIKPLTQSKIKMMPSSFYDKSDHIRNLDVMSKKFHSIASGSNR